SGDPFNQHQRELQKASDADRLPFRPPPELTRTLGIQAADERADVVLLQGAGARAFSTYQRNLLSGLIAGQKGYKLTPQDAAGSATTQRDQFRTSLEKKPAAILIDAVEGADLATLIDQAVKAGTPVISLDQHLPGCTTVLRCDPEAIGRAAAAIAIDALKRKAAEEGRAEPAGRVVQLRADESSSWSNHVAAGFATALQAATGPVLVHDAPVEWNTDLVVHRLNEALRIQRQFDIIFCHTDAIARSAAKVASSQNIRENTLIIGTEGIPGRDAGLQLLRSGEIDATIARPPLVDFALRLLVKLRADPAFKPKPQYDVAPFAVTPKVQATVARGGYFQYPEL
ncbi:MAG: substrate-binding domain-containing protein, partial [Verrucomicrobiaceae bacterium]|nr:substrate-binding domain-containing protein [Verrucomicrobiaceae bacterium]